MPWIILLVAGLFEIVWATAMKYSDGFTRPAPTVLMVVAMVASFWLLATAMRTLPLGTAYMVWTGIGALGSFVIGILFLAEPASAMRLLAAALIVAGIVTMKLRLMTPAPGRLRPAARRGALPPQTPHPPCSRPAAAWRPKTSSQPRPQAISFRAKEC